MSSESLNWRGLPNPGQAALGNCLRSARSLHPGPLPGRVDLAGGPVARFGIAAFRHPFAWRVWASPVASSVRFMPSALGRARSHPCPLGLSGSGSATPDARKALQRGCRVGRGQTLQSSWTGQLLGLRVGLRPAVGGSARRGPFSAARAAWPNPGIPGAGTFSKYSGERGCRPWLSPQGEFAAENKGKWRSFLAGSGFTGLLPAAWN